MFPGASPTRLAGLALVSALVLSSCNSHKPGHTAAPPPPLKPAPLVWALAGTSGSPSLDPAQATDTASLSICSLIYEGLVTMNSDLQVRPAAASSWSETDGGRLYTFHLRRHLTFSNGTPVTAPDVVGSLRRALGPASSNGIMGTYMDEVARSGGVPDIGARGVSTVTIRLAYRSPQFLSKLTFPGASIIDMALVHRYGPVWTSHDASLGSFEIAKEGKDGSIVLTRNPSHAPRSRATQLIVRFQSPGVAIRQFARGKVDVVTGLKNPGTVPPTVRASLRTSPQLALDYLVLNTRRSPLNNASVRRALAYSVNRKVLTRRIFSSRATAVASDVPPGLLPGAFRQTYSQRTALHQLQLAGHSFSRNLRHLHFIYPKSSLEKRRAKSLQSMWARSLGLPVDVVGLSPAAYASAVHRGQFDIALLRWGAEYEDAANFLADQLQGGSPENFSGWSNAHFNHLIAVSRAEGIDSSSRRQALLGASQIAATEAPWLPLDSPRQFALVSHYVHGLSLRPQGLTGWQRAYSSRRYRPRPAA